MARKIVVEDAGPPPLIHNCHGGTHLMQESITQLQKSYLKISTLKALNRILLWKTIRAPREREEPLFSYCKSTMKPCLRDLAFLVKIDYFYISSKSGRTFNPII
jgi:hypothetical protein